MAKRRRRQHSQSEGDGGVFALAGFINQMLGSAEDFVRCVSSLKMSEALLSFETEEAGQDLRQTVATGARKRIRILTQYKFSTNPTENTIGPAELKEIIGALSRSERKCNETAKLPTRKVLRSNRELGPSSKRSRCLRGIKVDPYNPIKARKSLEAYAARFGIFEAGELRDGIRRVISELQATATAPGTHNVTRASFDTALTGCNNPRSIAVEDAADSQLQDLEDQKDSLLGLVGTNLVDRDVAINAVTESSTDVVIAFTGDGGLGKTTTLWQVLRAGIAKDANPRRLAALITAEKVPNSFAELVDSWRGVSPSTSTDELALQRLEHANKNERRPILLLGLDGVDESYVSNDFRQRAGHIIGFFWRLHQKFAASKALPPVRLLVSCRRREDIESYVETVTGRGVAGNAPKYIPFDFFSISEIKTLMWRSGASNQRAIGRLMKAAEVNDSIAADLNEGCAATELNSDIQAVRCLTLLRHPILWSCFLDLDAVQQAAFVDGDADAQDALAAGYMKWFTKRAKRRVNFDPADVGLALYAVAKGCVSAETNHPRDLWLDAVRSASGYSQSEARNLYLEGISAGLIEFIAPAGGPAAPRGDLWRWQYPFFYSHLLRNGLGTH